MKTMCPPGYHHNGSVVTHALGHMITLEMQCIRMKHLRFFLNFYASKFSKITSYNSHDQRMGYSRFYL